MVTEPTKKNHADHYSTHDVGFEPQRTPNGTAYVYAVWMPFYQQYVGKDFHLSPWACDARYFRSVQDVQAYMSDVGMIDSTNANDRRNGYYVQITL